MNESWKDIIVTKLKVAVYVGPTAGKHIHKDRPFHGLVLNDSNGVKDYVFDVEYCFAVLNHYFTVHLALNGGVATLNVPAIVDYVG